MRHNSNMGGLGIKQACVRLKNGDRIPAKKERCLTPTLMDEGQARNPNTTYNGYIMESGSLL